MFIKGTLIYVVQTNVIVKMIIITVIYVRVTI